mmetsp:Transcript_7571/g.19201  ORF Transcript_7571/g.19201 Transcript_7571/m.19201 type:complete len:339 (-) Transcript_7571:157-1173(-)
MPLLGLPAARRATGSRRRLLVLAGLALLVALYVMYQVALRKRMGRLAARAALGASQVRCDDVCTREEHTILPGCVRMNGPEGHTYPEGACQIRMQRVPPPSDLPVPCIVHYMGNPKKSETHQFTPSWERCMPRNCSTMFWTDEQLHALVEDRYPAFLEMYSSAPLDVLRWDFARYLILHAYGGVYRDADYECTAPDRSFSLPAGEIHVVESPWKFNEHVQNSLMAGVANHPFWMEVAMNVAHVARHGWCRNSDGKVDVLASTGPTRVEKWAAHPRYVQCVYVLPFEEYFHGHGMSKHHGHASWTGQAVSDNVARRCGTCTDEGCKVRGYVCQPGGSTS